MYMNKTLKALLVKFQKKTKSKSTRRKNTRRKPTMRKKKSKKNMKGGN